jgi:hypothetical protein
MIHLYTVCWDEADMLGFFFRHYDPWVDRYVIYDDGSTDGSLDILRAHPRVEVRQFERTDAESFVLSHTRMQQHAWRESRGQADWVVITAIDEHLWVRGRDMQSYLAELASDGVTCVPALGFDMNSETFPRDQGQSLELRRLAIRPVHPWSCVAATVELGRPQGFQHGGRRTPRSKGSKRFARSAICILLRGPPCFLRAEILPGLRKAHVSRWSEATADSSDCPARSIGLPTNNDHCHLISAPLAPGNILLSTSLHILQSGFGPSTSQRWRA